jgi:hypothetical protein
MMADKTIHNSSWMSDEAIGYALEIGCDSCGVDAGESCVTIIGGTPLVEYIGSPVHYLRLEAA